MVINNQLGFTTAPASARTSVYPTDVAKMVQAPIFHVNGDDPEACVRAARLAFSFRQTFHKDVVIDLVCYRKHGHNEGDDPSYTQPLMYQRIEAKRSVRKLYTETLVRRGDITLDGAEAALDDFNNKLQAVLDEVRGEPSLAPTHLPVPGLGDGDVASEETGVAAGVLHALAVLVRSVPDGFTIHPKLERQFSQRDEMVAKGQVDWALAESLAMGSLLRQGVNVRLTGQDTRRGTFSQRHAVLVDYTNADELIPLSHLGDGLGRVDTAVLAPPGGKLGVFTVRDSLLSEYAAVGFEYGYSVEAPEALVMWEAQFGDFANGAQIIIDNFLAAAEIKWGQLAGLVMLLPHGYEGQGPEHSSARIERFLSLCARGNMRVAIPSTSAQYFHLLRSQGLLTPKRPLVVVTPKSMLRARGLAVRDRRARARGLRSRVGRSRGDRTWRTSGGSSCAAGRSRTRPCAGAGRSRPTGRRLRRWSPSSASSSSTRGPTRTSRSSSTVTRRSKRWCGCRKSRRTWAPGPLCTPASTPPCPSTCGFATSAGVSRPVLPSAVLRCTSWSRPTCCGAPLADSHHVVVDGSNLATEGRTLPSLAQLDEAVRAYAEEDPESRITVVVDASFEHRIDESEREALREAMLNGEVVSPPAGAIGRGDAVRLAHCRTDGCGGSLQRLVPGVSRPAPLALR